MTRDKRTCQRCERPLDDEFDAYVKRMRREAGIPDISDDDAPLFAPHSYPVTEVCAGCGRPRHKQER